MPKIIPMFGYIISFFCTLEDVNAINGIKVYISYKFSGWVTRTLHLNHLVVVNESFFNRSDLLGDGSIMF